MKQSKVENKYFKEAVSIISKMSMPDSQWYPQNLYMLNNVFKI